MGARVGTAAFLEPLRLCCREGNMESVQGGPTFDDLSIDDDLTQLERVKKYCTSSIALQRLVHAKVSTSAVEKV